MPGTDTRAARAAFLRKFEDQVDPERKLSPAHRELAARKARREYFSQLGKLSRELTAIKAAGPGQDRERDRLRAELRHMLSDVDFRQLIVFALGDGEVRR